MRKHVPNLLTLLNLLSGCIAITLAFKGNFTGVVTWVFVAALFDFTDGFAARLLNAYSPLGKELDSLADVVSFGVAPASALFILLQDHVLFPGFAEPFRPFIPYLALLIPLFSAYRLAKFNIDERQTRSFLGLPTPASGLFWVSYCHGIHTLVAGNGWLFYVTLAFLFILSPLMAANIPMFSLKLTSFRWKGNERQALLAVLTVAFIALWGVMGIAAAIVAYILLSLLPVRPNRATGR
ncbi:MAG: CDP-diacylglycerol--serine O-phosphatidyltransferase [Proteiniphilum sp.]